MGKAKLPLLTRFKPGPPLRKQQYYAWSYDNLVSLYEQYQTPAIFPRDERLVPPQFYRLVLFTAVVAAVTPVISYRYGQPVLEAERAWVPAAYQRFPYFKQPVIPSYRYGRDVLSATEAFVPPQYQRFPYFTQPANPPVPLRYGQTPLIEPSALVVPAFYQLIPFASVVAPASPVITFLYGQTTLIEPVVFVPAHYQPFPFQPPAPASPVPAFRMVRLALEDSAALVLPQRGRVIPVAQNRIIPYTYGQWTTDPGPVFAGSPGFLAVPAFQTPPAAANLVIPFIRGQWISDAVEPLVGIQGYQRFPYLALAIPNQNRLFIDVDAMHLYWRITPTSKFLIRLD